MSETIQDIVYALHCAQTMCFAARASGLYRSTDGGRSWQSAYASLSLTQPLPTTSVVLSPDFAADRTVFAGVPGGVLYSLDGGETWRTVELGSPPPVVSTLALSPDFRRDGVLLAGTMEDGVFRSGNRGTHWAAWNFGLLDLAIFTLAISPNFAADEMLFAGVESGIFRSTNGGRAWREVTLPIGYEPVLSLALSPAYAQDGTLFAGTESQGVWRSADRGQTWTQATATDGAVNGLLLAPDFPATPRVLALLDHTLLLSRDAGQTWRDHPTGLADMTTVHAPAGLTPGASLLVGTSHGEVGSLVLPTDF
ncbi:MAG TPA: hypothetical protein PKH77_10620 [Anaerolineae bacterium]|nr:hypothetical protein [Anaerolineae bacterium]